MTYTKDPSALLDYACDWSQWLAAGETIASAAVIVPSGLTKDRLETANANGLITVWLSGGSAGSRYDVRFQVTTSAGRTDERSIRIRVSNR